MDKTIFEDPNVEVLRLHSSGYAQDFQLFVKLPWNYGLTNTAYPVLYGLDANRGFHLFSDLSQLYETPGASSGREIIIVGIGYSLDAEYLRGLAQWAAWRARDLTPARNPQREQFYERLVQQLLQGERMDVRMGGAELFLNTLRDEIIPLIEQHYRTSPTDRGLVGYSFGGLFALYALFKSQGLFTKYAAGSPSMWEQVFDYEAEYAAAHDDLNAKLVLTAGGLETEITVPLQSLADRLVSRNYPSLEIHSRVFEGEGHVSATAAFISRALNLLYYPNQPGEKPLNFV